MGAAGPAAGAAHAFFHFIEANFDAVASGFGLFGRNHPADPFVPSEGRDIRPQFLYGFSGSDGFFEVGGDFVHGTARDYFTGHKFILPPLFFV